MNKILTLIITILIPITIISFQKKETNFIVSENKQIVDNVKLVDNEKVINIPFEEYLIGVVAGEMPALYEIEALKAQAVASRTYIINKIYNNPEYQTTGTINDQVYLNEDQLKEKWQENYDIYYNKIKEAVEKTSGIIIKYDNKPIKSYYYASSNGYTASSENVFNYYEPYLITKKTEFDKNTSKTISMNKEEFCQKLEINCDEIQIKDIKKDESNRVSSIEINNTPFTGIELRKKLGIRSTDFDIVINNTIQITTRGYGHGVGMSQNGSNEMAKLGYTYEEIILYYYNNVTLEEI